MADVCISYDEKSAESVARQISETLEKSGISCWYVGRDMEKGALRGAITEAIEDCRVFLLILSEQSIHSEYVKNEIALALQGFDDNRKRELVAFRVDNSNAEAQLNAFLDKLRARDDFPSNIAPFQIAWNTEALKTRIRHILTPQLKVKKQAGKGAKKFPVIRSEYSNTPAHLTINAVPYPRKIAGRVATSYAKSSSVLNKRGTTAKGKTSVKLDSKKV